MRRVFIVALFLLLVACAPAVPPREPVPAPRPGEAQIVTQEEIVSPPQALPPKPAVEEVVVEPEYEIDPYSQLGCESLLTEEEFAQSCGKSAADFVVTYKIGTKNCFVNVKDRANERLTAGITLTGYADAETAEEEFDRRLVVLKVGADKSVGERAYEFPKLDRETIHFLRDEFILEVGSDTRLCDEEGLYSVARIVDGRLK